MNEWHNENCDMEYRHTYNSHNEVPQRSFWCKTHNQWAYIRAKVTYHFEPHFSDKFLPSDLKSGF